MNKKDKSSEKRTYMLVLVLVGFFAVWFVGIMGQLNYRSIAFSLHEEVIAVNELDAVTQLETAISFGKSFDTYYGIDDLFRSFSEQIDDAMPFVISKDGRLMYAPSEAESELRNLAKFLSSTEMQTALPGLSGLAGTPVSSEKMNAIFIPVTQEEEVLGYFGAFYRDEPFLASGTSSVRIRILLLTVVIAVIEAAALFIFVQVSSRESMQRRFRGEHGKRVRFFISIAILSAGVFLHSVLSIYIYQDDYRRKVEEATHDSLQNLEDIISKVQSQGVEIREVTGLKEYIYKRVNRLDTLRSVRITERIVEVSSDDESSDIISFVFGGSAEDEDVLYLEAEISDDAIRSQIRGIVLTLLSTVIILFMFVFEMNKLVELLSGGKEEREGFSERRVGTSLRLTGFLCSTAEYMCVPYAAMMIRESGESLFGLSVGLTAALPLTLEGVTQMIAMMLMPKLVKKLDVRKVLVVSSIMMIACNIGAFKFHAALAIIIFRALAGVAYSGFKQVSNYLITRGYNSETGRSNNIAQDNAGLLAGSTCGAGLGAILCANMGYPVTFIISAVLFGAYLLVSYFALPWKALETRGHLDGEEVRVSVSGIRKMIFSPEMLFYILLIGVPLNIGVMLCVTLVPAICQTNGINSVMLSYCYIANGIAGIYIGPALVSWSKKKFGLLPGISFAFGLTAIAIFILKLPGVIVMIVISSMILGFLDGFGTPLCTDRFMDLDVVKHSVDESTALIFSVVISYVLLSIAPMIAELLLLPGKGAFSPMIIGAVVYAAAAVLLFLRSFWKKKKNLTEK
ncbi:MAG: MFS transporter [Lachnospiraceae bacterium]|nr:MFS transporter [Lachnospiraceae bacterium]